MTVDPEHRSDKLALFVLAGLVVTVLGCIALGPYVAGSIPDKSDVLLGTIATGLILFLRDLVNAVRSSWDSVERGKVSDKLANSGPVNDNNEPPPKDAVEGAKRTADAANEEASKIEGEAA